MQTDVAYTSGHDNQQRLSLYARFASSSDVVLLLPTELRRRIVCDFAFESSDEYYYLTVQVEQ